MLDSDGSDGSERLWDISSGHWTGAAPVPSDQYFATFGADPHSYLVSAIDQPQVRLRAVSDGRSLFQARANSETNVATTADGRLVAVCPVSGPIRVRDTARHRDLAGGWASAGANTCAHVNSRLEFAPGGHRLASVSSTGLRVWDTATGQQIAHIDYPGVSSVAFSKDGNFLAATGAAEIAVWRLSAPRSPSSASPSTASGCTTVSPGIPTARCCDTSKGARCMPSTWGRRSPPHGAAAR